MGWEGLKCGDMLHTSCAPFLFCASNLMKMLLAFEWKKTGAVGLAHLVRIRAEMDPPVVPAGLVAICMYTEHDDHTRHTAARLWDDVHMRARARVCVCVCVCVVCCVCVCVCVCVQESIGHGMREVMAMINEAPKSLHEHDKSG
jgi:hypothetical protein